LQEVYSSRFICVAGLSGTGTTYLVPSGKVAVVKQVTAYCSPGAFSSTLFLEDDATGAALWQHEFQGSAGWAEYFGSWVFEPGQGFHFQLDVSPPGSNVSADVYAGGYLLNLP
jgi:hypothetical protein